MGFFNIAIFEVGDPVAEESPIFYDTLENDCITCLVSNPAPLHGSAGDFF